jgi:hypothetical protein
MARGVVVAGATMGLVPAAAEYVIVQIEEVTCLVPGAVRFGPVPECCGEALFGIVCISAKAEGAGRPVSLFACTPLKKLAPTLALGCVSCRRGNRASAAVLWGGS